MKPKRQAAPSKAYYSARALLSECFGLNEGSEIPQDYDDLPASLKAAVERKEE